MSNEMNIKGFNKGYELAGLDSALAKSILKSINENSPDSMIYFKKGVEQKQRDVMMKRLKGKDRSRGQNKGIGK